MGVTSLFEGVSKEKILSHVKEKGHLIGLTVEDICFREGYGYFNENEANPRYGAVLVGEAYFMALYHEIAHAAEIVSEAPERLSRPWFGMGVTTQIEVAGIMYDHPISTQATERECRVNAIQAKLMAYMFDISENIMLEYTIKESADSLNLMHDHLNIKVPDEITEFKAKEAYRIEWVRKEVRKAFESISLEHILQELEKVKAFRLAAKES